MGFLSKYTGKFWKDYIFLTVTAIKGDPSPFHNLKRKFNLRVKIVLSKRIYYTRLSGLKAWFSMVASTVKNGNDHLRKGNRCRHIGLFTIFSVRTWLKYINWHSTFFSHFWKKFIDLTFNKKSYMFKSASFIFLCTKWTFSSSLLKLSVISASDVCFTTRICSEPVDINTINDVKGTVLRVLCMFP